MEEEYKRRELRLRLSPLSFSLLENESAEVRAPLRSLLAPTTRQPAREERQLALPGARRRASQDPSPPAGVCRGAAAESEDGVALPLSQETAEANAARGPAATATQRTLSSGRLGDGLGSRRRAPRRRGQRRAERREVDSREC